MHFLFQESTPLKITDTVKKNPYISTSKKIGHWYYILYREIKLPLKDTTATTRHGRFKVTGIFQAQIPQYAMSPCATLCTKDAENIDLNPSRYVLKKELVIVSSAKKTLEITNTVK